MKVTRVKVEDKQITSVHEEEDRTKRQEPTVNDTIEENFFYNKERSKSVQQKWPPCAKEKSMKRD